MKYFRVPSYIVYSMILIVVGLFLISYYGIKDANACLNNPLVYGATKASSLEGGDMFCSCSFDNELYAPLFFDKDNITTNLLDFTSEALSQPTGGIINES